MTPAAHLASDNPLWERIADHCFDNGSDRTYRQRDVAIALHLAQNTVSTIVRQKAVATPRCPAVFEVVGYGMFRVLPDRPKSPAPTIALVKRLGSKEIDAMSVAQIHREIRAAQLAVAELTAGLVRRLGRLS